MADTHYKRRRSLKTDLRLGQVLEVLLDMSQEGLATRVVRRRPSHPLAPVTLQEKALDQLADDAKRLLLQVFAFGSAFPMVPGLACETVRHRRYLDRLVASFLDDVQNVLFERMNERRPPFAVFL